MGGGGEEENVEGGSLARRHCCSKTRHPFSKVLYIVTEHSK
jgi:hypothetical protein